MAYVYQYTQYASGVTLPLSGNCFVNSGDISLNIKRILGTYIMKEMYVIRRTFWASVLMANLISQGSNILSSIIQFSSSSINVMI